MISKPVLEQGHIATLKKGVHSTVPAVYRTARLEYKDAFAALYEIQGEFDDWAFPFLDVLRQILTALGECGERRQTTQWIGSAMAK